MSEYKQINVHFYAGDDVFIYNPNTFSKYEIKEEKIAQIIVSDIATTYTTSNGYTFQDSDIGYTVFKDFYGAAASRRKEVLNEN